MKMPSFGSLAGDRRSLLKLSTAAALVASMAWAATPSPAAAKPDSTAFSATVAGTFSIAGDVGKSVLFAVQESGTGNAQATLEFTYRLSVLQNLAKVPEGCGPSSSSAVEGFGVLSFTDGDLTLRRVAGTSCFAFPTITVEEQWVVSSGTGRYVGATGVLWRQMTGDVRFGSTSGILQGMIRFVR